MSTSAPSATRSDTAATWRERSAPFTAEVEAVTDWESPSPCEGWRARDVLAHVVDTEREFLASVGLVADGGSAADGASVVDDEATTDGGSAADGEAATGGDAVGPDPVTRWSAHLAEVDALLADPEIADRPHEGAFGPTTVGAVMLDFYGFDLIVHRWDLARSQGRDARLTAAELALVDAAVDGWGEHAYAPGIFGRPVAVPADADEQTSVLARTGRRA